MNVIRQNVEANQINEFEFDQAGLNFQVKNLTEKNIYVCLGANYVETLTVVVLPNTSETLIIDEDNELPTPLIQIYAEKSGEVEIQCLKSSSLYADFDTNLSTIETGVYGKDIRKAIHDCIKAIHLRQLDLERKISLLINKE